MACPYPTPLRVSIAPENDEAAKALFRFRSWLYARKGLAAGTVELRVGSIRRMIASIGVFPAVDAIEDYVCALRQRVSYSHLCHALLAIEKYQEFRGEPLKFDRPRKPKDLIESTLSEAEVAVFLASIPTLRNRALLTLLAYSGIRNAEICDLRIEDVDLAAGIVRVRKGKGDRAYTAAIAGPCVELLAEYLRERNAPPQAWLFVTSRCGNQLEPQDLRKIVRVAARRAGFDRRVHPHLFRHSLAMAMLHRGANIFTIQKQLGHAFVDTTLLYLRSEYTRARNEYLLCAPSYL